MFHARFDVAKAAKLVSKVSDIQADGGIPSFEHGRLNVLTHHCFAIVEGQPCTLYFDSVLSCYRVLTISEDDGRFKELGQLTASQLNEFNEKSGFFLYSTNEVRPARKLPPLVC